MQLLDYWPRYLQELLEFNMIAQAEQPEFDAAAENIACATDDLFLATLSEYGIKRWEKIIGITANPATETLDFRRKRILNTYSVRLPFTKRWLAQKLDVIIGPGLWDLNIDNQAFKFYIQSAESNQSFANELLETVNQIKPANMEFYYVVWVLDKIAAGIDIKVCPYFFLESGAEICGTQYSESIIGRLVIYSIQVSNIYQAYVNSFLGCGPEITGTKYEGTTIGRVIFQTIQATCAESAYITTFPQCGPESAGTLPA